MNRTSHTGGLRIGDAEREAAISVLGDHYAAGRITHAEFEQRSSLAFAARTNAQLWPLFRDLPEIRAGSGGAIRRRWHPPMVAPFLLVVVALVLLTHLPWPLILVIAWLCCSRMLRHRPGLYSNGSRRAVRGSWS